MQSASFFSPRSARSFDSTKSSPQHLPSRKRLSIAIGPNLKGSLKLRQQQVVSKLDKLRRTIKTAKTGENLTEQTLDKEDSFAQRFNPGLRTYSHRLIGEVKLHNFAFNVAKDLGPVSSPVESQRSAIGKFDMDNLASPALDMLAEIKETLKKATSSERKRRVMSSITHFRRLNIDRGSIYKLSQMIPNKPFGIKGSRDFLKACKEGDLRKCAFMLKDNRWLAQVRDHVSQTGLHWAARRNNVEIAKLLISYGCFVDSRDIVRSKQAGRTPLHVACKFEADEVVRLLLESNADPYLKTNAGTYPYSEKPAILKMISKSKAKQVLQRFTKVELSEFYIG